MTTVTPSILIQMRHPRARKEYICHNCSDIITKSTYHDESVIRLGTTKYKDPIVHWRMHSDCQAPWWQPWAPRKLTCFGALPKRVGTNALALSAKNPLTVSVTYPSIGVVTWEVPAHIVAMMHQSKRVDTITLTTHELQEVFSLIATSLTAVAGKRKLAMKLSHALHEIIFLSQEQEPLRRSNVKK